MALLLMAATTLLSTTATTKPQPWDSIRTWCFPCFAKLPLTEEQLAHYTKFDQIDVCAPGLVKDVHGQYVPNVTHTTHTMAVELLARNPTVELFPYLGFELGQSWYAAQTRFNADPFFSSMWLRYANGSTVICDQANGAVLGVRPLDATLEDAIYSHDAA
jgi:hypothetical protein